MGNVAARYASVKRCQRALSGASIRRMMIIRRPQMEALRSQKLGDFRCRLRVLVAALPEVQTASWTPQRIDHELDLALEQAAACHLQRESDIAHLAEIFCTRLGGFNATPVKPQGMNILYAYGVDPADKLKRFAAFLDEAGA